MTLNEAYEKTVPGQKIKHLERQLVLIRTESFMEMICGLGPAWADVLHGGGWIILPAKKVKA